MDDIEAQAPQAVEGAKSTEDQSKGKESDRSARDNSKLSSNNNGKRKNPSSQRPQQRIKNLRNKLRDAQNTQTVVMIGKTPPAAKMKLRHFGVVLSFLIFVALPSAGILWYLEERAADQFVSRVGFVVHTEDTSAVTDVLGGAIQLGNSGSKDTDILYEFIRSQQLVSLVDKTLDLRSIYSRPENDPIFTFDEAGTIEDLWSYWSRMVRIYYDVDTQLIELRVHAFVADDAYNIAQEIFKESTALINKLSTVAREDSLRYAREELEESETRLKIARQALTQYRNSTNIVDPNVDAQGQMGLLNTLQQKLANALIEHDMLAEVTRENDHRIIQAIRKIDVIRKRIAEERQTFGLSGDGNGDNFEQFNDLLSEFEALTVDREFAEKAWLAARFAYDGALVEANRQSRYMAAFVGPTLAERAEYPDRILLWAISTLVLFLGWAVLSLIGYSIKDRR